MSEVILVKPLSEPLIQYWLDQSTSPTLELSYTAPHGSMVAELLIAVF
jgi:hypothetical protein